MSGRDSRKTNRKFCKYGYHRITKTLMTRITCCRFFLTQVDTSIYPKHVLCQSMGPSSSLRCSISCARPEMDPLEGKYHMAIVCPSTRWKDKQNVHMMFTLPLRHVIQLHPIHESLNLLYPNGKFHVVYSVMSLLVKYGEILST